MTRAFLLLLPLAAFAACRDEPPAETVRQPAVAVPFEIDGSLTFLRDGEPITTIDIELADDDSTRTRGLMDRTEIPPATGMLFTFPNEELQGFWMQNTYVPLDIIYFDADSSLVNVQANAVPHQIRPTYNSTAPAQYVVEVPAGFARRYGLTEGVTIDWALDEDASRP